MTQDELVEIGARAACEQVCGSMRLKATCRCIGWRQYEPSTRAALSALTARGLAVVPVEPTDAMLNAPPRPTLANCNEHHYAIAWRAMLRAAALPKDAQ